MKLINVEVLVDEVFKFVVCFSRVEGKGEEEKMSIIWGRLGWYDYKVGVYVGVMIEEGGWR